MPDITKAPPRDDEKDKDRGPEKFKFNVDGAHHETDQPSLTGARIKVLAGIDMSFGLFLESHGNRPDQQIADSEIVDLSAPGREQFYTVPPATFGGRR